MSAVRRPQPEQSDGDLLAQIALGDLGSMGLLFDRYEADVRRFLGWLRVPKSDADDLVQATFLDVARAASRYDRERAAKAWILGLATMQVRRYRRSVRRAAARIAAWAMAADRTPVSTPADAFDLKESTSRALFALQTLSPKKREVFVMVVFERLSGEQVARALDIPLGTVWTRLHHARVDLRRLLGESGDR